MWETLWNLLTFPQVVENPVENVRYSLFYSRAFHPLFLALHGLFGECRAIRPLWICGNFPLRPRFVFSPVFPLQFPQPAVRTPPLFRRKMPLFIRSDASVASLTPKISFFSRTPARFPCFPHFFGSESVRSEHAERKFPENFALSYLPFQVFHSFRPTTAAASG